jgi:hypothetical protein
MNYDIRVNNGTGYLFYNISDNLSSEYTDIYVSQAERRASTSPVSTFLRYLGHQTLCSYRANINLMFFESTAWLPLET